MNDTILGELKLNFKDIEKEVKDKESEIRFITPAKGKYLI
ncbi:hypothetical protein CLCOS_35630 [Clostridium coskatii]|uniref:Uncharacterized protein n=1 Tax=Clostridium coskatii TaxID=1705578 RepID=A0A162KW16_9CLOT|nr:hypothetical protein WX73_02719 [Clostridium coskatii]OBR91335.1 hypothetical protein CLCOS_35630 [Clostridium coskatii]